MNRGADNAADYYPVSVFRKKYLNPELVKRTIETGSFERAFAELSRSGAKKVERKSVTQLLPPKVEWLTPQSRAIETAENTITVKAKITSDSELTGVKLLLNGRTFATERGMKKVRRESDYIRWIEHEIALNPGDNELTIFAENVNSSVNSEGRLVTYNVEKEEWMKPNLYMVSIGVSDYEIGDIGLDYPDDDARAMSRMFRNQKGMLFNNVTIKELYNRDATQDNILDVLDWLERNTTQKDVAIVFVASHGYNDSRGNYYILPSDGNPDKLRRTGVSWHDFSDILGNLPSRVLLFLDTCHSGQLGSNLIAMRGAVDNTEAIRELSSDENGVVILAASTGREYSQERAEWGHGAFTKALIEGLEQGKADYSGDGIIHLRELDVYLSERVKTLTGGVQHPTTQKPSTISRLPLYQIK